MTTPLAQASVSHAPTVLIIGGGIIGISSAIALTELGFSVTLVDKNSELGQESSHAGAGILFPLHPWLYDRRLHHIADLSLKLYPAWIAKLQQHTSLSPHYVKSGMLYQLNDAQAAQAHSWLNTTKANYVHAHQWLSLAQARQINPQLAHSVTHTHCLWLPNVHQVRNPFLLKTAIAHAQHLGVRLVSDVCIAAPAYAANAPTTITQLYDQRGDIWQADHYVWCSGAWTAGQLSAITHPAASNPNHLSPYSDSIPASSHISPHTIKPIKGQMLLFKQPANWMPTLLMQDDCYIVPRQDGHILVGASVEDVGFDKNTTDLVQQQLLHKLAQLCPQLATQPIVKQWAGLRPYANEFNLPYIGKLPQYHNGWINAGHYRYGLLLAPYSAATLADLFAKACSL